MKRILILIAFSTVLFSCQKVAVIEDNPLVGNWIWEKSVGGIAGTTITPQPGQIRILRIYADSTYVSDVAGNNHVRNRYSIGQVLDLETNTMANAIFFYDETMRPTIPQIYKIVGTELTLKENCVDCYTHSYNRMNE